MCLSTVILKSFNLLLLSLAGLLFDHMLVSMERCEGEELRHSSMNSLPWHWMRWEWLLSCYFTLG